MTYQKLQLLGTFRTFWMMKTVSLEKKGGWLKSSIPHGVLITVTPDTHAISAVKVSFSVYFEVGINYN